MSGEQMDLLKAAETRRDLGIERVRRGAGDGWTLAAARFLAYFAASVALGQEFLIEDAAQYWVNEGRAKPRDGRAWGGACRLAAQKGWIERAGYAKSRSSNMSPKCTWRRPLKPQPVA